MVGATIRGMVPLPHHLIRTPLQAQGAYGGVVPTTPWEASLPAHGEGGYPVWGGSQTTSPGYISA